MSTVELPIQDIYPAPPERVPVAPRAVALNYKGRNLRLSVFLAFLGVPNVVLGIGWLSTLELHALEAKGQVERGHLLAKRTQYRGRSGTAYLVCISYEVEGRKIESEQSVTAEEYAACRPGNDCDVTYLPSNPETSCFGLPGPHIRTRIIATLWLAGIVAAALAVGVVINEIQLARELALARDGEPLIGKITDRGTSRAKNRTLYWARYAFMTPDGDERTSWNYVSAFIWENLGYAVPITILVDPTSSRRHCPLYAFKFVRILEEEPVEEMT